MIPGSQEAVDMMERILAWTGDRAGELGRPELQGAGQVSQEARSRRSHYTVCR